MKLSVLSLIAALLMGGWVCSAAAPARHGRNSSGTAPAHLKNQMQNLAAELNLTADQKEQLRQAVQKQAGRARALRANTSLNQAHKRQQLRAMHQELQAKIKSILTPEQLAKWQQLRGQKHAHRQAKS
jgi:Spy/CpxP family protein refolding chaperone